MARDNGGIIGVENTPTSFVASGVWSIESQYEAQVNGTWPPIPTIATNALRFDDGSAEYLSRTTGTSIQNNTFVFSVWTKISKLGDNCIFTGGSDSNNYGYLAFSPSGTLNYREVHSGTAYTLTSNAKYRDTSAWYHIYVQTDLSQSTASNRVKIYVNGEQVTSFSGETYPPQNSESRFKQTGTNFQKVGDVSGSTDTFRYRGYMAEVCYIDTTSSNDFDVVTPTSFGEFDANGIWTPIPIGNLTYGTNGFRLKFENSASLGLDSSPNGNNFTVNNLTSVDQTTDTPTNNFATWNPLNAYNSTTVASLSEGNLKVSGTASDGGISSTIGVSAGKWYWEVKYTTQIGGDPPIGIINSAGANKIKYANSGSVTSGSGVWCMFNLTSGGVGFQEDGVFVSYPSSTLADGDILNIAIDVDAQKLWYGKNGTWYNSGNPAAGTNAISTNLTANETWFAYCEKRNGTSVWETNFGNPPFTISSGNSDANGYGNFEYAVPTGYYALCTKNLATYG